MHAHKAHVIMNKIREYGVLCSEIAKITTQNPQYSNLIKARTKIFTRLETILQEEAEFGEMQNPHLKGALYIEFDEKKGLPSQIMFAPQSAPKMAYYTK